MLIPARKIFKRSCRLFRRSVYACRSSYNARDDRDSCCNDTAGTRREISESTDSKSAKKIYSELNQALLIAQKDYGSLDSWDLLDFENATERGTFFGEKYLFPYIKTIKKCFPVSSDCWAEKMYTIDNKTVSSFVSDGRGAFISASGYSVLYWVHGTGNGGWFWVDTNGPVKKPNTFGKDIFPFIIAWGNAGSVRQTTESDCFKRLGIYPLGLDCSTASPTRDDVINGTIAGHPDYSTYKCKKGSGSNHAGAYCGALLIYDGWQMKDDYPW